MSYTLDAFANDCHRALVKDPGPNGRRAICEFVSQACLDDAFVATHLGKDNTVARKLLYKDAELGFCIFAHAYEGASDSTPHDHGPSWAIYGQAAGTTTMTDWQVSGDKVTAVKSYDLDRGDVYLYNEGDVHSPSRQDSTRLVRIEGINMDGVKRNWYKP